jgi:septal ring factor EnvC (AmiA/AmiB activator)
MSVAKPQTNIKNNYWEQLKKFTRDNLSTPEQRKNFANNLKKKLPTGKEMMEAAKAAAKAATAAAGENAAAKAAAAAKTGDGGEKRKPKTVDPPLRF